MHEYVAYSVTYLPCVDNCYKSKKKLYVIVQIHVCCDQQWDYWGFVLIIIQDGFSAIVVHFWGWDAPTKLLIFFFFLIIFHLGTFIPPLPSTNVELNWAKTGIQAQYSEQYVNKLTEHFETIFCQMLMFSFLFNILLQYYAKK